MHHYTIYFTLCQEPGTKWAGAGAGRGNSLAANEFMVRQPLGQRRTPAQRGKGSGTARVGAGAGREIRWQPTNLWGRPAAGCLIAGCARCCGTSPRHATPGWAWPHANRPLFFSCGSAGSSMPGLRSGNPNGISSSSPGLQGTSYPGLRAKPVTTLTGLRHPAMHGRDRFNPTRIVRPIPFHVSATTPGTRPETWTSD